MVTLTLVPTYSYSADYFDLELDQLTDIPVEIASLFEESALDVASSTAIISRDEIQQHGFLSLGESLESVPSVFTTTTWGGSEAISIRGYSTELSVRGTAYYLDDIPLGTYVYASTSYILPRTPLGLLESVEMIRGPGSTLYGTDAFHGVVRFNLVEENISSSNSYIQMGSPDLRNIQINNSQYTNSWQLHSGIQFTHDKNHDLEFEYSDPFTGELESSARNHEVENLSMFLKARNGQITSERGQISLTLFHNSYQANEFQGIGSQFFVGFLNALDIENANLAQGGDKSNGDSELSLFSLNHEILLKDELQLKNQIYHWKAKQEWSFDNSEYPTTVDTLSGASLRCRQNEGDTGLGVIGSLYCPHELKQGADESRTGYSIQIKHPSSGNDTQWVLGAGIDHIQVDDSKFERINLLGTKILDQENAYDGKSRDIQYLMAQARSSFNEGSLLITYGLRWDQYSDVSDHLSPRLGLIHRINHEWTQKVLYGHAYRAPTAIEQFGSGPVIGNLSLKPETIDTSEYIIMFQRENIHVEGVLFYSDWRDAIALEPTGQGTTNIYRNIDRNFSQGLELTGKWKNDRIFFQLSSSYVDSKNSTEDINYNAFPDWIINLHSEYSIPRLDLTVGLSHRAMFDYELSDDSSLETNMKNKEFHRSDIFMQYKLNQQRNLVINIQNLFDKDNSLPSYYSSQGGLPDYGVLARISFSQKF